MPKSSLSSTTFSSSTLSKPVAANPTIATGSRMVFLILMAMAIPGCKKNRSEPALQILPDPQAEPRSQAPTDTLPPRDTAAFPIRNDLTRDDSTALDFVTDLYANYGENSLYSSLGQGADTLFAPDLLALILQDQAQAKGEVGYLDGDPVCDCQDNDITDVRVTLRKTETVRLQAEVGFLNLNQPVSIGLSLLRSGKGWRIEDIRTRTASSLRNDLRAYLTQSQTSPKP